MKRRRATPKITIEVELNEAIMDVIKESIKNMPQMPGMMRRMMQRRSEEKE